MLELMPGKIKIFTSFLVFPSKDFSCNACHQRRMYFYDFIGFLDQNNFMAGRINHLLYVCFVNYADIIINLPSSGT